MATQKPLNTGRLMLISNLAIFMIGLGFAVRANIAGNLQTDLFDLIDPSNSAAMVGEALGITFTGFALTLLFGSALVDFIGMRAMLLLSATGYIVGSALVLAAASVPVSDATYWLVSAGLLLTGLGWGAVEAASNPLITTLFPQEKTHRLNILHAWWPAGIVVGGLSGVAMGALGLSWQLNLFLLLIPGIILAGLALRTEFPVTERVASGVSYSEMFGELKRQPMFLLWLVCMLMTASAELAPGQWVDLALSRVVGMDGILLLVYISALMFVMRHFAGPIVERVSSVGLLWISSILAVIGLYGLGRADSPATAFAAATVWGMGVCFMWPTMLANVSERFPRGGALFLGLIGFCGGMAIQFVLPQLGAIFDRAKIEAAGGVDKLATLSGPELDEVLRYASVESFSAVALIPLALIPIFGFIWWRDRHSA